MEFKTIVYIIIGLFWLASRFFQKVKQGNEESQSVPLPENTSMPDRQVLPRQPVKRGSPAGKNKAPVVREQFPSPVSLENPATLSADDPNLKRTALSASVAIENPVTPSDAERISDEIRNGQMDWRRALIISELINRKSGH